MEKYLYVFCPFILATVVRSRRIHHWLLRNYGQRKLNVELADMSDRYFAFYSGHLLILKDTVYQNATNM